MAAIRRRPHSPPPPTPTLMAPLLRPRGFLLRRSSYLLLPRLYGSVSPEAGIDLMNPTYVVWGSNTGVGKTLVCAGLAASVLSQSSHGPSSFLYLKPVQTGFPVDSDSRFVCRKVSSLFRRLHGNFPAGLLVSDHVLNASNAAAAELLGGRLEKREETEGGDAAGPGALCAYEETRIGKEEIEEGDCRLVCKTLFGWKEAISPHLAVEREGMLVEDSSLRKLLGKCLRLSLQGGGDGSRERVWRVIETAGGVASPGPSGTLQCDLYRYAIIPAIS